LVGEEKKMIKNYKILLWIFFVVVAVILIAPNPFASGFVVVSGTGNIQAGDKIVKINDLPAELEDFQKEYKGIVKIETDKGTEYIQANGTLGIAVTKASLTRLNFGLDIKGGVRAIIKPEDDSSLDQIISTLQTRINVYGLRESNFRPVYVGGQGFIEVSISGGSEKELRELIERQGKFEAKIPVIIKIVDSSAILELSKKYTADIEDDGIRIDGTKIKFGGFFVLEDIPFVLSSVNNNTINLTSTVFTGSDIRLVHFDPQRSRIEPLGNGYNWIFAVELTNEGAEKFAKITKNIPAKGQYLDSRIHFVLDDIEIDALNIASDLRGRIVTEVSISGSSSTLNEARDDKLKLQSILRSGSLPTKIEIAQIETISPNLGENFLQNAAIAAFLALIGITALITARYRKLVFILPIVIVSFSEILIILGMSVLIGWTIDLAAIAGIMGVVGTGIDTQIIMIDQALRKSEHHITLREKMKRAFFIIFGAAGTVIAAMFPLLIFGFGVLRGFAIVTILGVLIGIFITRPAFGAIIEKLVRE
jgi:preprotein translocase subunit SecD